MGINQSGTYGTPRLDTGAALMEWLEGQTQYVGTKLFPTFKTMVKAGNYPAITRESILSIPDTKRGPRGTYNRIDLQTKDKSFACVENGLELPVGDDERAKYSNDFDAIFVASKILMTKLLTKQEQRIAAASFNTSTFTGASLYTDVSGTPWDSAGSDVLGQVRTASEIVRANCGMSPNTLTFSKKQLNNLMANTAIRASIAYVARVTDAEIMKSLADLFNVQQVLVAGAVYNSADEGQTFTGSDVWSDDYALLSVTAMDGQDLSQPSLGRCFLWTEDSETNSVVETYTEDQSRSEVVRVRHSTDEKLIDPYFGHLLKVDA